MRCAATSSCRQGEDVYAAGQRIYVRHGKSGLVIGGRAVMMGDEVGHGCPLSTPTDKLNGLSPNAATDCPVSPRRRMR
jgi:hypothetical protein